MLHCSYCDYFKCLYAIDCEDVCRMNLCEYSNVQFTDADLDVLIDHPCMFNIPKINAD